MTVPAADTPPQPADGRPRPSAERWQPLRAGLVDIFYYDQEEFHFHGGSLLLRGNNGTGKSKVLALTVPFLLDGELSPYRVEPDGDPHKRMEWNLLLGGRHPHPERLGYTWLEFGRRDRDGDRYLTIGCGLKAVAGRGIARHWFFVTSQRVGVDLALVGATGTALARERLREAIGAEGMLYDRAVDYRRAVDEALFGLGSRYDALISLLIRLRQPQLSKRPDEKSLSRALGDALPPLDENLITQVAEAFRSLDDERETLRELTETKRAADEFLTRYRQYARVATRRRAAVLRQQHSRYEQLGRDLTDAHRAYEQADAELTAALERIKLLTERSQELSARSQALRESPEARTAEHLGRLRDIADQRERLAGQMEQRLSELRADVARIQRSAEGAARELERARQAEETARERVRRDAEAARLGARHASRVLPALDRGLPEATAAAEELIASRATSLRTLDRLRDAADHARGLADRARDEVDRLDADLAAADLRIAGAETAATEAGELLVRQTRAHLTGLAELRVDDAEAVLAALEQWVGSLTGENPAVREISHAARNATETLARADAAAEAEQRTVRDELARIEAELRELAEGGHQPPPAPHTRTDGVRRDRPGAPLWRVVDFAPHVPPDQRAGIEAALEAAGILDAWLDPDGALRDRFSGDTLLRPGPPAGPHLGGLLRPAIDPADPASAALTEDMVTAVLTTIGLGSGSAAATWVDPGGAFGNGILTGWWSKPAAEHIGDGAREAYRRSRVEQLRREGTELAVALAAIGARREELLRRRGQVTAEVEALPSDQPLREAHTLVRGAYQNRRDITVEREEAVGRLSQRLADSRAALAEATEFAGDVDLPYALDELAEVRDGLQSYRVALATWWPTVTRMRDATIRREDTDREQAEWLDRLTPATTGAAEARQAAATARVEFQTLHTTAGASVAELRHRIAEVTELRQRCDRDSEEARRQEGAARDARGDANGQRTRLREALDEATQARDQAVDGLRAFAGTGLIGLACPEVDLPDTTQPWAATPAVTVARGVERLLADTEDDDRRWARLQQQVSADMKTLTDTLSRHGHQVMPMVREEIMVVDVTFQGRLRTVADLSAALVDEIAERQRVLSAHEREVLETHLVNEVAGALQELIVGAERQVDEMNAELQARPTSTGMRLRLLWRPTRDAPAGLAELRGRQLRQSTDVWNDDDRRAVGAFLQEQIDRERLRDDAATWTEQLTRALDYRAWHEFAIQRHQDGQWRSAAGPASGGERVLAASIPLFAAASSYYGSAGNPYAPRLIALDEAFAGVDDDSRAKCLGLLATFDLDVVMTSEREWGCYPQVPGLGIAQLSRHDGIDAVLVTPWRWDGRQRRPITRPEHRTPLPRIPESGDGQPGTPGAGDGYHPGTPGAGDGRQVALWGADN